MPPKTPKPVVAEAMEEVNDQVSENLEDCFLGCVIVDIRDLDLDDLNTRNRALKPTFVARLCEVFKNGVRRYALEDHIKVSVQESDFGRMLNSITEQAFLVEREEIPDRNTDLFKERYRKLADRVASKGGKETDIMKCIELPDPRPKLIVRNGQHRIHALSRLLKEQAKLAAEGKHDQNGNIVQFPRQKDWYWAIDIYNENAMSSKVMAALTANRVPVNQINSDGYFLFNVIGAYNSMSTGRRVAMTKPADFKRWCHRAWGLHIKNPDRILTVLRHDEFRNLIAQFCATRYGETVLTLSWAEAVINAKLDVMWQPEFGRFLAFANTIFGVNANVIKHADWCLILSLEPPRPDYALRVLFFPERTDYWIKQSGLEAKIPETPFPLPAAYQSMSPLPKMQTAVTIRGQRFQNRRPDFLEDLDDSSYVEVFNRLRTKKDLDCPTWDYWTNLEKNVSKRVKQIMPYILVWCDQRWGMPRTASTKLKSSQWAREAGEVIWNDTNDAETRGTELVKDVWKEVNREQLLWNHPILHKYFKEPSQDDRKSIETFTFEWIETSRFGFRLWHSIVDIVLRHKDEPFTGFMTYWNDPQEEEEEDEVYQPYSTWGMGDISTSDTARRLNATRLISILHPRLMHWLHKDHTRDGYLAIYVATKQIMLDTLTWGRKKQKNFGKIRRKPRMVIRTLEEWNDAVVIIKDLDEILRNWRYGWNTEPDNCNENLDALRDDSPHTVAPGPRKLGFLTLLPPEYEYERRKRLAHIRDLNKSLSKDLASKRVPSKRKHHTEEAIGYRGPCPSIIIDADGIRLLDPDRHFFWKSACERLDAFSQYYAEGRNQKAIQQWQELTRLHELYNVNFLVRSEAATKIQVTLGLERDNESDSEMEEENETEEEVEMEPTD